MGIRYKQNGKKFLAAVNARNKRLLLVINSEGIVGSAAKSIHEKAIYACIAI
jgi:hypothetical protein